MSGKYLRSPLFPSTSTSSYLHHSLTLFHFLAFPSNSLPSSSSSFSISQTHSLLLLSTLFSHFTSSFFNDQINMPLYNVSDDSYQLNGLLLTSLTFRSLWSRTLLPKSLKSLSFSQLMDAWRFKANIILPFRAKDQAREKGGTIKHEYSLIKGFT